MQKTVKILIISLVLLIPVVATIFLNIFGENQYEIPIYYMNGNPVQECGTTNKAHRVSNDLINFHGLKLPALVSFSNSVTISPDFDNVLSRYEEVNFYYFSMNLEKSNEREIIIDSVSYNKIMNCEMIMGETKWLAKPIVNKSVLVDKERRIRGYYILTDIDDVDRLDTELDILTKYK